MILHKSLNFCEFDNFNKTEVLPRRYFTKDFGLSCRKTVNEYFFYWYWFFLNIIYCCLVYYV